MDHISFYTSLYSWRWLFSSQDSRPAAKVSKKGLEGLVEGVSIPWHIEDDFNTKTNRVSPNRDQNRSGDVDGDVPMPADPERGVPLCARHMTQIMTIYGFQKESMVIDPSTPQVPNTMFHWHQPIKIPACAIDSYGMRSWDTCNLS